MAGVELGTASTMACEDSLAELAALAKGLGVDVVGQVTQRLKEIDPRTFIGRGKVAELARMARERGATLAVFDDSLSPVQARNLERELQLRLIDRSQLILDIFAQRARSSEGKIQVEMAQLSYLQARLTRQWSHLSRLSASGGFGGYVGARGPGETQLEVDRRRIMRRIAKLESELRQLEATRHTQRRARRRGTARSVSLVGYTNAGKSTLLNRLTGAGVLVGNKLFATLDPRTRRLELPGGEVVLCSDTVGFVRKLPHQLVESFHSTLEVVADSDLLVHVVDASAPAPESQMEAVRAVLGEIGAAEVPELLAFNKADAAPRAAELTAAHPGSIACAALTGEGVEQLLVAMGEALRAHDRTVELLVPYERGDVIAALHRLGEVVDQRDAGEVLEVRARLDEEGRRRFAQFTATSRRRQEQRTAP